MKGIKIAAILLVLAGVIGLVFSPFSYNSNAQSVVVGPIGVGVTERRNVNVPDWASVGAILAGTLILIVRKERPRTWG